jgi:hypothetical protein
MPIDIDPKTLREAIAHLKISVPIYNAWREGNKVFLTVYGDHGEPRVYEPPASLKAAGKKTLGGRDGDKVIAARPPVSKLDDLTAISGVGAKMASALHEAKLYTYWDLVFATDDDLLVVINRPTLNKVRVWLKENSYAPGLVRVATEEENANDP